MWFAQTPIPSEVAGQVQAVAGAPVFTIPHIILLGVYFTVCLGLIICVTLRTNKAEGLMQQSMAAPTQSSSKGKTTGEERLSKLTDNLAYAFLFLSMIVATVIKI